MTRPGDVAHDQYSADEAPQASASEFLHFTGLLETILKSVGPFVEWLRERIASEGQSGVLQRPPARGCADLNLSMLKEDILLL